MPTLVPQSGDQPDDRDLFTIEEVKAAFTFILSENDAEAYVRDLYSATGRGVLFLDNTYNLLSLLSADVAERVRERLGESESHTGERMREFVKSVALRKTPYRGYE